MTKLDEIFHKNGLSYSQLAEGDKTIDTWVSMSLDGFLEAKQAIISELMDIVGDMENTDGNKPHGDVRNQLRAELRERITEWGESK